MEIRSHLEEAEGPRQEKRRFGARVIAYLGKGGTGKTVLSALTAKLLISLAGRRLLLIDADPVMGLSLALGLKATKTVGSVREAIVRETRAQKEGDRERLSMMFDYLLMEALQEFPRFNLLVMGAMEGPGCYCPLNSLLREGIEELAMNFDYIVIDAEAGIEQVSRQVTKRVDFPIMVTDSSWRGIATALSISDALEKLEQTPTRGVIFNRSTAPDLSLKEQLARQGISCLGAVPEDQNITRADLRGQSLLDLDSESPALAALAQILGAAGIIGH